MRNTLLGLRVETLHQIADVVQILLVDVQKARAARPTVFAKALESHLRDTLAHHEGAVAIDTPHLLTL